jgi:hypothetical protein
MVSDFPQADGSRARLVLAEWQGSRDGSCAARPLPVAGDIKARESGQIVPAKSITTDMLEQAAGIR